MAMGSGAYRAIKQFYLGRLSQFFRVASSQGLWQALCKARLAIKGRRHIPNYAAIDFPEPQAHRVVLSPCTNSQAKLALMLISSNQLELALSLYQRFIQRFGETDLQIWVSDYLTNKTEVKCAQQLIVAGVPLYFWPQIKSDYCDIAFDRLRQQQNDTQWCTSLLGFLFFYNLQRHYQQVWYFAANIDLSTISWQLSNDMMASRQTVRGLPAMIAMKNTASSLLLLSDWQNTVCQYNPSVDSQAWQQLYQRLQILPHCQSILLTTEQGGKNPIKNSSFVGINMMGYFANLVGMAEPARCYFNLAENAGIALAVINIDSPAHPFLDEHSLLRYINAFRKPASFTKNLFFINANMLSAIYTANKAKLSVGYNAAIFWWEFDDYFRFPKSTDYLDEVIVYSGFIKTALQKVVPERIKLTQWIYPFEPVSPSDDRQTVRQRLAIDDNEFVVFFSFDMCSSVERKNPQALIAAFSQVFAQNPNASLLIKVNNMAHAKKQLTVLHKLANNHPISGKIRLFEQSMPKDQMMSLIAACDVVMSLHRSEGLGLLLLEAMSLAVPVIATGYGGNTDFMNDDNAFMVDYTMTEVKQHFSGVYQPGYHWAEPSVEHAAKQLHSVYQQRTQAQAVALRGQQSVLQKYSTRQFQQQLYQFLLEE